jgi:hypothetical protein
MSVRGRVETEPFSAGTGGAAASEPEWTRSNSAPPPRGGALTASRRGRGTTLYTSL